MPQQVQMPKLSQTMETGRVVQWLRAEGDAVVKGEPLVTIETDKATSELEAPGSGTLIKIAAPNGSEVPVDALLGVIGQKGEDIAALLAKQPPDDESGVPLNPHTGSASPDPRTPSVRKPVTPAARKLARELGVDPVQAVASGKAGLITEQDVRALASSIAITTGSGKNGNERVIPLTGIRGRIAHKLSLSRQTAADVTTVVDVDVTAIDLSRETHPASYTAYVIWAAARALQDFPELNAWLIKDKIFVKNERNIGVAVALDEGLIVPVVRTADRKRVTDISLEIETLAERARAGILAAEEVSGATLTVTNSGVYGSILFTPIINQPEVAILGIGRVTDTPVVRDGQVVIRRIMYLCLSYDHRAIDGAPAVRFLQDVKRRLELPNESA